VFTKPNAPQKCFAPGATPPRAPGRSARRGVSPRLVVPWVPTKTGFGVTRETRETNLSFSKRVPASPRMRRRLHSHNGGHGERHGMEAPRGDVALARAGVSGADASSCQDGDLAARMAKTRRELKVWETEFATAHGRAPNKDDAALASGVKEMYGLYRSLKGKLDKENAVAGTEIGPGGVKQAEASAARSPRGAPLVDAARGGVESESVRGRFGARAKPNNGVSPSKTRNRQQR
jgi:hypothetical protein